MSSAHGIPHCHSRAATAGKAAGSSCSWHCSPPGGPSAPHLTPAPIWEFPHRENPFIADGASDTRRNFIWIFVPPPATAAMQTTIGGAVPVSFQSVPAPNVTSMVPQASVQPGVPGVQGQGAQLPLGGMPLTVVQLPAGAMPETVGLIPPQEVPPIVVQLTPEGLYTIVGHLPPGERQLPLLQLLPGGMKPGMPPPNAPAHCWQHPRLAGKWQRQRQQPMGLRPGAVCRGKPPQPAGSCPLQAPGRPGPGPSTVLRAPPVQLRVLPGPCTLPASWEQATGPFADAVAHTQEQRHPAPTNVCPHPATAPLGCSSAALESGGEFGGCAAGGRLSAPGGCGKAVTCCGGSQHALGSSQSCCPAGLSCCPPEHHQSCPCRPPWMRWHM